MVVSIVMICYNVEQFIDEAIECIKQQTYTDWELIISDDASTDNTVRQIKKHLDDKRIKLFVNKHNLGFIRNKNIAFSHAQGDLITLMDSDDTCTPDRIERQVAVFMERPEIMICATNYRRIDDHGNVLYSEEFENDMLLREIPENMSISYNTIMVRSQVVEEFGAFSEYFTECHGEDQYWTLRIMHKYPLYFIRDILYNYRLNAGSLTSNLNHPRQLILPEILGYLKKQRKEAGTDCLERGRPEEIRKYEATLLNSKTFMAEKYRERAVREIDMERLDIASEFLRKSFSLNKWNKQYYKTLRYYFAKKMRATLG